MNLRKLPLTKEQKSECEALKKIWDARRSIDGFTQESVAAQWGVTQSLISHHLNGHNALNKEIAQKFAALLNVPVSAFSQRIASEIGRFVSSSLSVSYDIKGANKDDVIKLADHLPAAEYAELLVQMQSRLSDKLKEGN